MCGTLSQNGYGDGTKRPCALILDQLSCFGPATRIKHMFWEIPGEFCETSFESIALPEEVAWLRARLKALRTPSSPTPHPEQLCLVRPWRACHERAAPQSFEKASSTLRSSRAVPHPSTNRALRRLTSEVGRDPVHSTRYGRQRLPCLSLIHI